MKNSGVSGQMSIKALTEWFQRWSLENPRGKEFPEMVKEIDGRPVDKMVVYKTFKNPHQISL